MNQYLFLYRMEYTATPQGTPEQMQAMTQRWMDWMGSIAAQNKLADRGNRLKLDGAVVRGGAITNGPYVELKESLGGYSLVKADSYEEAIGLAKDCPIHAVGGSVEVREINPM